MTHRLLSLFVVAALVPVVHGDPAKLAPICQQLCLEQPKKSRSQKQEQAAELTSYLFTQPVVIGLDASIADDTKLATGLKTAIDTWNKALPDSPLRMAGQTDRAMLRVKWAELIGGSEDTQGRIEATRQWRWGAEISYTIEGSISVRKTVEGRPLTADETTQVMAHELGHLLGLDDVPLTSGIMGPMVVGLTRLGPSKDEVDKVQAFRQSLREKLNKLAVTAP